VWAAIRTHVSDLHRISESGKPENEYDEHIYNHQLQVVTITNV